MRRHLKPAACAALFVVAGMALAQTDKPLDITPTNLQIRGGIFIPLDTNLRSVSDNFAALGVDVMFPQEFIPGSKTFLSVDWLAKSLSGAHGNIFPICINQKFYGKPYGDKMVYGFVGLGATIFDVAGSSNTVLGARGGVGVDLGPNVFLEGTLFWSDRSTGDIWNIGTGFYLGYRW